MPLVFSSVETIRVDEGQSSSAIPEIVTLTGGGFAVAWRASIGGEQRVITQAFEADGDKIGTNQQINPTGALEDFELGGLAGGGFAVVYNDGTEVRGNIFEGTSGNTKGYGTAFDPPYEYEHLLVPATEVKDLVLERAGATLQSPTDCH